MAKAKSKTINQNTFQILVVGLLAVGLVAVLFPGIIPSYEKFDTFGIVNLYESAPDARTWESQWDNGYSRSWTQYQNDPYDVEFVTKEKSSTSAYSVTGGGILKVTGNPRMYVIDPARTDHWENVEITMYGKRIADNNTAWAGLQAMARTNHFVDADVCDTRGIGARIRLDGHVDFEKESSHPSSQSAKRTQVWDSMPKDQWIGYKYVVYDLPDGSVKIELYYDLTDGKDGGTWQKVIEMIDTGNNFGVGGPPCTVGANPADVLNLQMPRFGSESGNPNFAVYFRNDGVDDDGFWYKKASIREIKPPV